MEKAEALLATRSRPGQIVRELYGTIKKHSGIGLVSEAYKLGLIRRILRWVDKGYLAFENQLLELLTEPGMLVVLLFPYGLTIREIALLDIFLEAVLAAVTEIEGSRERRRLPGYFLAIDDMGAFTRHDAGALVRPTIDFIALRVARGLRIVRMFVTQTEADLTPSLKGSAHDVGAFNWLVLTTATNFTDCYGIHSSFGTTAYVFAPEVRIDPETRRVVRARKWRVGLRPPLSGYAGSVR